MKRYYMLMWLCMWYGALYSGDGLKQVIFKIGDQSVKTDLYVRHFVQEDYIDIILESAEAENVSNEQLYAFAQKLNSLFYPEALELIESDTKSSLMQRVGLKMNDGSTFAVECFVKGYHDYSFEYQCSWAFEKMIPLSLASVCDEVKQNLVRLFEKAYLEKKSESRCMTLLLYKSVTQRMVDVILHEQSHSRLVVTQSKFQQFLNNSVLCNVTFVTDLSSFVWQHNGQEIKQKNLPDSCKLYLNYARVFERSK